MNYLKKYNLSDKDIEEIYEDLSETDLFVITSMSTRVKKLLDYFNSIGITNFKDMFMYRIGIFYQHVDDIKKYIEESDVPDIIEKLKEDVSNFELLGI